MGTCEEGDAESTRGAQGMLKPLAPPSANGTCGTEQGFGLRASQHRSAIV